MARQRLKWMDYYRAHGNNAALTSRHFGISRQTFYRWRKRYNPRDLSSLESRSVRPHQALDYLTPYQFLTQWQHLRKEAMCH